MGVYSPSTASLTNPFKFSAYRNAAHTSSGVDTKIDFDTEEFDTNNNFATGTYTVPVNGFYFFTASAGNTLATTTLMRTSIAVNGTIAKIGNAATPDTTGNLFTVNALLSLTAGNTVEAYFVGGGGSAMQTGANQCYFQGFLVSRT